MESIADATRTVSERHLDDGPTDLGATPEDTVNFLIAASGGLYALHDRF